MPVVSRIDWVMRQLQGRSGHVLVGPAQDPRKLKVRIVLQRPAFGALSPSARMGVDAVLAHVRLLATQYVAVDRGHKHSSGLSEVAIWIHTPRHMFVQHGVHGSTAGLSEEPDLPAGASPYGRHVDAVAAQDIILQQQPVPDLPHPALLPQSDF